MRWFLFIFFVELTQGEVDLIGHAIIFKITFKELQGGTKILDTY